MRRLLLTALLLIGPAHTAAPPPQWLPQESWPGRRQYDARLERTVKFWGTGVPAADLFASMTAQTGVPLGFDPPDDDNARICLNVYLNPKEPPTLRDLLVQIGWVMDSAWAVEGEGEQRRYVLLRTSIGEGALADYERWRDQAGEARDRKQQELEAGLWQQARGRLPELREALELPREEAIRRYSGDPMLLTLLDPVRRAVARFMLSLPEGRLAELGPRSGSDMDWGELSVEQREWLREAIQSYLDRRAAQQATPPSFPWRDAAEVDRLRPNVTCWGQPTGIRLEVSPPRPWQKEHDDYEILDLPSVVLVADPREPLHMFVPDALELRRLLGEQVDPEQEEMLAREAAQKREEAERRQVVEEQIAQYRHLSEKAAGRLSGVTLHIEEGRPYALWQIQEAVAARSGFSVVSDCLWQSERPLARVLQVTTPRETPARDALSVLTAACSADGDRIGSYLPSSPQLTVWEWSDAGRMLRFRSADRALWREAMLAREVVRALDGWVEPYLSDSPALAAKPPPTTVPLEVRRYAPVVANLTPAQLFAGAGLTYEPPDQPRAACYAAFRRALLANPTELWGVSAIIASLDQRQWAQLKDEGLVWGKDLRLNGDSVHRYLSWATGQYQDGDLLRFDAGAPVAPGRERWGLLTARSPKRSDRIPRQTRVPLEITVHPSRLQHLVPPPPEYAP